MRALAEERGWPRVPNDGLASLCPGIGQSITEALGSRVVLAADGAVYKVPTSQEDGGDSYINDAPVDIRGSLPSHGCENEQYVKGIFDGDDRTAVVPELVTYAPFPFAQKVWNVSFKPYRQLVKLYVDGLSFGGLTYGGGVASGAFVGPRHVLTVGHAFDTFSLKYPDVSVEAGASGDVATYKGNSSEVYFIGDGVGNDLALVVLPDSPEVAATGWFGTEVGVAKGEGMRIYGYPEWDQNCYSTSSNVWPRPNYPKCGAMSGKRYLYFDTCQVGEVFELANSVYYRCDTTKGQSGGPLIKTASNERIFGVHKGAWTDPFLKDYSYGTRISTFQYLEICSAIADSPSDFANYYCGQPYFPATSPLL